MSRLSLNGFFPRLLQGMLIGAGGILPGVSGGVLAVVFGVYRPAMEALAHPRRALSRYWGLLLPVGVGAALGFLAGTWGVLTLFERSETVATALFAGLILGTLPALWREAGAQGRGRGAYGALALSFSVLLGLLLSLRFGAFAPVPANFFGFLFAGVILALGVIVPGLAASPVLMSVDLFAPLVAGVKALDFPILLPLALGTGAALALFSRLVNHLFRARYAVACHAVFGIVLASLLSILPTRFSSSGEGIACLACAIVGALLAHLSGRLEGSGAATT